MWRGGDHGEPELLAACYGNAIKTAIARTIALAQLTNGWEAHECIRPEEIWRVFDPDRPQVFVADHAFGSTEYRADAGERWASEMERILGTLDDRHWLIWTSRPAPLKAGLRRIRLERGAERFPSPGEVLVDASALDVAERTLILFRHAKAAQLSQELRLWLEPVELLDRRSDHFLRTARMGIEWVHPSWRDLVIEHLAEDRTARLRFLSHCSIHGAALALSVAGGRDGQRRMPLLVNDADWDALSDRLYVLLPGLDGPDLSALLSGIHEAILRSERDPNRG